MRGSATMPNLLLAHGVLTRTQHEVVPSFLPTRSQWKNTFTRPYLSVWISSPAGPTTVAVCGPWITGRTAAGCGWNLTAFGTASKRQLKPALSVSTLASWPANSMS